MAILLNALKSRGMGSRKIWLVASKARNSTQLLCNFVGQIRYTNKTEFMAASYFSSFVSRFAYFFLGLGAMGFGPSGFAQDTASPAPYFEGSLAFEVEFKGQLAPMLKENEPNTKLLMHLKDADYIVQLSGGRYPKTFIFVADSNVEYSMDMANKRAFRYSSYADLSKEGAKTAPPKAVPTGKKEQVHGIWCEEYRVVADESQFLYYVNDEYRVNLARFPSNAQSKASFLANGLEGRIPLKTIKRQQGLMAITTLTKATPREFDKEQFQIPPNFLVKNRDYRY